MQRGYLIHQLAMLVILVMAKAIAVVESPNGESLKGLVVSLGSKANDQPASTFFTTIFCSGFWRTSLITLLLFFGNATVATSAGVLNGDVVSDAISVPGERDTYTFTANAGENVVIRVADTSNSSFFPAIALYDPSGKKIGSVSTGTVAYIHPLPLVNGTYTVLVYDGTTHGDQTGNYNLYFARMPGANEGGPLINGGFKSGTIDLGDVDSYTFTANAGENVVIRVADTSNNSFAPAIALYDPSGKMVGTPQSTGTVAYIHTPAPVNGTYTVLVYDAFPPYSDQTGNYNLYFARMPGANEGGPLINGGLKSSAIDLGDVDSYTFTANAGENVVIRVADTSNNSFTPQIALYDPRGKMVGSVSSGTVASLTPLPLVNGTYTVLVYDRTTHGDQTGNYNLYFARMPGANEGGPLINGGFKSSTIDLGDVDSYTFTANAGENVVIRVADTSNNAFAPLIALYDPSGKMVDRPQSSDTVASLTPLPLVNGSYTVLVYDNSNPHGDQTGNYRLELLRDRNLLSYAALGDSYSSGEGLYPFLNPNDHPFTYPNPFGLLDTVYEATGWDGGCHRSARAYPYLLRLPNNPLPLAYRPDVDFDFFACTGAETENVSASGEPLHREPTQMTVGNAINESRDLITISIGGNDAYWAPITTACIIHRDCNGYKPFVPYSDLTLGEIATPLAVAYAEAQIRPLHAELRQAAPNAAIIVLGYPLLVSGQECPALQLPFAPESKLSVSEQAFLRQANIDVNTAIERSAAEHGLHFVASAAHFAGHEACGLADDWVNGVAALNPAASFHPTSRGQAEFAKLINAYLESVTIARPYGLLPNGLPNNPPPIARRLAMQSLTLQDLPNIGWMQVRPASAPSDCLGAAGIAIPGESLLLLGNGYAPNDTVAVSLAVDGVKRFIADVTADSKGVLNTNISVPADYLPGKWGSIEALGAGPNGKGSLLLTTLRFESSTSIDFDGDGVSDICDNCATKSNSNQHDTDRDGYGNMCDADLDNNEIVNTLDLSLFKSAFGQKGDGKVADLDGNFVVNTIDLSIFKGLFGKPPGPANAVQTVNK